MNNNKINKISYHKKGDIFFYGGKSRDLAFVEKSIGYSDMGVIKTLAKTDFDFNKFYSAGYNSLHLAIIRGKTKLVEFLLNTGKVDPNILTNFDINRPYLATESHTPLTLLCYTSRQSSYVLPIFKLLLDYGADPTVKNSSNENVFDFLKKHNDRYRINQWCRELSGQRYLLNSDFKYLMDFLLFFRDQNIKIYDIVKNKLDPSLISAIDLNLF